MKIRYTFVVGTVLAAWLALHAPAEAEEVTADAALIGGHGTLYSITELGANYLRCIKATSPAVNFVCWFKYPAVVLRDFGTR